jgi:hypothetical protein
LKNSEADKGKERALYRRDPTDEEHQTYGVEIRRDNYKLNLIKLLTSPEFRELRTLHHHKRSREPPTAWPDKGGSKRIIYKLCTPETVFVTAKSLTIQRYKILRNESWAGETMDPEKDFSREYQDW